MKSKRFPSPLSGVAALCGLVACALLVPGLVRAGAVYRCVGPNGQMTFTNKTSGYGKCSKIAEYAEPAASAKHAPTTKQVDYRSDSASTAAAPGDSQPEPAAPATADASKDSGTQVRRGAVYKVSRINGVTEYTNIRPNRGGYQVLFTYISTCYACNLHSTVNWRSTALNREAYRSEVAAAATEFGVDPALLRAVIHAESAFNPNALSNKGAQGLMQLIPGTASDMGVNNPFDVSQNIRGGAQYLAGLLKEFKGDERLATAAYNAGPQNVLKYNGVPPFDETRVYVDRVATLRQRYHATE
jgi:soluble lytic murein transglycosylase-like protein